MYKCNEMSNKTSISYNKFTTNLTMNIPTFILLFGLANCAPKKSSTIAHFTLSEDMTRQYKSGAAYAYNTSITTDVIYRNWTLSDWIDKPQFNKSFHYNNGRLTVKRAGTYFVYAQMTYHDISGRWAFGINVNDAPKIKCLATEQLGNINVPTSHGIFHQCYTASLIHLDSHDVITIQCLYGMRTILTSGAFTFWGLMKF